MRTITKTTPLIIGFFIGAVIAEKLGFLSSWRDFFNVSVGALVANYFAK